MYSKPKDILTARMLGILTDHWKRVPTICVRVYDCLSVVRCHHFLVKYMIRVLEHHIHQINYSF